MCELLRIEMSRAQVKDACKRWAYARSLIGVESSDATVTVDLRTGCAAVVFRKKRAPRPGKQMSSSDEPDRIVMPHGAGGVAP